MYLKNKPLPNKKSFINSNYNFLANYKLQNKLLKLISKYFLIATLFNFTVGLKASGSYKFIEIGIEQGLSQSSVLAIYQDSEGYLWFGTANGLNKYDGYSFTVFTHDPLDPNSISDIGIKSIFEDDEGNIWIGTNNGVLNKYDKQTGFFTHYNISNLSDWFNEEDEQSDDYPIILSRNLLNSSIVSIVEDDFDYLWIGTWGKGLVRFKKSTGELKYFYHSGSKYSLSSNKISVLYKDNLGNIWIGTFGGGLNNIPITELMNKEKNPSSKIRFYNFSHKTHSPNSLSDDRVTSITEDIEHNLLIGTFGGGLNLIRNEDISNDKISFTRPLTNVRNFKISKIMSICNDPEGNIWVGTFGSGLVKINFKKNIFTQFLNSSGSRQPFPISDVLSVFSDKSGIIWAGSHLGKGIVKVEKELKKFNLIKKGSANHGLNDDIVWSIFEDNGNSLWIGTYKGGLNKFNLVTKKYSYFTHKNNFNSISGNHVRAVTGDKYNTLWVGTYSNGLNRFVPGINKWYTYRYNPNNFNSLGSDQIQAVYISSDSILWVGTFGGGLCKTIIPKNPAAKLKFERFEHDPANPKSISDNRIYVIYKDQKSKMWIGTFGGLNLFDLKTNSFTRYVHKFRDKSSLSDNRVISISRNIKGNLLVGTYGGGLNVLDTLTGKFKRFMYEDGLTSDAVYSILKDKKQNLWISTDNGLFRYDQINNRFTHYDEQDGIQSKEFSGGAYFKNKAGEMFFGGIKGINYFYPDSIKEDNFIPPVVITSISVLGKKLKGERKRLKLNYNQNFLTFRFASLDFYKPRKNIYKYKLVGLDDKWHTANANYRSVSYTNLSPGDYIFKVRGTNSDGFWTDKESSVFITILSPFWLRWWFILSMILIIGGMITYFINQKIKHLVAMEKLKTKLSADLHDNIGAGLTEISILSELVTNDIKKNSGKAKDRLTVISELSRSLIDNMSDIVWVVNPKRDSLHDLIVRLKDSYNDILRERNIKFRITNLESIKSVKLPLEYKQNLFLILKEALNNSLKHSRGNEILMEIEIVKNFLKISISDNGKGFEYNKIFNGNGLKNMKRRAKIINGTLEIYSEELNGTTIKFSGKIKSKTILKRI